MHIHPPHTQHWCTTASSKPTVILRTFSGGWVADQPPPEDTAASVALDEHSVHGGNKFLMTAAAADTQPPRRTSRLASTSKAKTSKERPAHSDSGSAEQHETVKKPSIQKPTFSVRMSDALPSHDGAKTAPAGATTTAGGSEEPTVKGGKHAFDLLQAAMHLANQPPAKKKKAGGAFKRSRSEAVLGHNSSGVMAGLSGMQPHSGSGMGPSGMTNAVAPGSVLAAAVAQVESLQQHNLQLLAMNANLEQQLDSTRRMMFLQHQELLALRSNVQQMQAMQAHGVVGGLGEMGGEDMGAAVPVAPPS